MNTILKFSSKVSNLTQKIFYSVLYSRRLIWKKRAPILGALLLLAQLASPLSIIVAYAAPTASTQVGSSAALDPVGNKATRLQTQGSSGVDQSSGALTYSYPLTIPDGRNGMSPKLALSYNSQNNDTGWFGYGWNISIPYIERTTKTGTDKMYTSPVFVSSLHGELISNNGTSYEQKVDDGSYAKYSLVGTSWQITDRDGTTYYFGNSYTSRVQDDTGTKIGRWYLTEVRDKFGNGIIYNYTKDSGTIYPSTISYTEHALAHPLNLVTFTTENKNDSIVSYKYGFKTVDTKRVSSIKVATNGRDNASFSFVYTAGANGTRSLLQSIEEKHLSTNDDWTVLPKTIFEYEKSTIAFSGSISTTATPYSGSIVIDTNNDGIQDMYYTGDASAQIDINGDYKKDLLLSDMTYSTGSNGPSIIFRYNQGGSFLTRTMAYQTSATTILYMVPNMFAPPLRYMTTGSYNQESAIVDINGDGFDDIVYNDPYGGNSVAINTTGGKFSYNPSATSSLSFNVINDQVADVNGDGLQDKISKTFTSTSTIYNVYLNNGSGYSSISDFLYDAKIASSTYDIGVRFLDVNNDGLTDVLRSYSSSSTGGSCPINQTANEVLINTGISFATTSTTLPGYLVTYSSCAAGNTTREYDTNGDLTVDYDYATNNTPKQDVLKKVTSSLGSTLETSYTWTPKTGLNPNLPVPMYIVATTTEKLFASDANPHAVGYGFYNGQMYFDANNPRDRKFAGFAHVDVIDGKSKTVTYYHQGNSDDYTTGEKGDSYYNIGRSYRTDTFDLSSGSSTLVAKNLSLYTTYSYASSSFTYLDSQVASTYNQDGTYISSGSKNVYDEVKRLIKTSYAYGDVEPFISFASSTITDKGTDLLTTQYQYSNVRPQRLVKQVTTDYAGNTVANTSYYYDSLPLGLVDKGAVTSVLNTLYKDDGTVNSTSTKQTAYDATGNVIQSTDGLNKTTKITYDSGLFFPVTKVDALNGTTTFSYDPYTLNILSTKGPDGITYIKETDGLGKVTRSYTVSSTGGIYDDSRTIYAYSGGLNVYSQKVNVAGQSSRIFQAYDSYGRLIQSKQETLPDTFSTQDTKYDANSNVISTSLPYTTIGYGVTTDIPTNGSTIYAYDGLGRVTSKSSFGTTLSYQYGARSLIVQDNASTQHKKSYSYDANGNLSQVGEYNGGNVYTTNYNYTPLNKLSRITDANGNIRNFSYISNGSLIYQEDPHAANDSTFTTYSYGYDVLGNILTKTGPLGTLSYSYDALNRPTTRVLSDTANGTSTVTIAYTGCSNNYLSPCSINRGTSSTTLGYEASGKLNSESLAIDGKTFTRSYTYDSFGNPATITYPDSGKVTYTYTLDGKQSSLTYTTPSGAVKNIVTGFTYNSLGSLASLTFGNGVQMCNTYTNTSGDGVISPKLAKSAYIFNTTGCASVANQIELYKDEFTYKDNITPSAILSTYKDIAGVVHTKSDTFTYDNVARLTGVSTSYDGGTVNTDTLVYDPIGNLLKENDVLYRYSQDGMQNAHAVTSVGGTHVSYDAQGNRIQVGDNAYTWNALNQMLSASTTNGSELYTYDENGERIKKVVQAATVINQKVTPATATSTLNSFRSGDLLAVVATSSTYIATSTYSTLSSLLLLDKTALTTLAGGFYSSPFTSKFCATATSTANRQSCIATTTLQLLANNINSRSTSTVATTGLINDIINIVTGTYLIPSTYTGLATSSIATSATSTFSVNGGTISSYNTYVETGVVVPLAEYANLPYVSTSTYNTLSQVGLGDTSKVRALLTLSGCTSVVSACATAEKVVFEKYYKENGYLFSDRVLQEMWYVFAAKARLPGNGNELTSTSTYLGSITVPTVSSLTTSNATSTYYSDLYFTTEYNAQNTTEPRLPFFNTTPYFVTQSAFAELQQAGITQTTLQNYQALIADLLNIRTASSTEYMNALASFALYDKKTTLSTNALKELYLTSLGASTIPNNSNDYILTAIFDLSSKLVINSYRHNISNNLFDLLISTSCHSGSTNSYGDSNTNSRCVIGTTAFTLPVATSSQLQYVLTLLPPPTPAETVLSIGESLNSSYPISIGGSGLNTVFPNGFFASTTITIDSGYTREDVNVTGTVVKQQASSTAPEKVLIVTEREWVTGTGMPYDAQTVQLKAYASSPRLTLASTTLVSSVTNATTTSFTAGIQSYIAAYFGEISDSSNGINVGTSTIIRISSESLTEFASTTLRDSYDIGKVFLATSTPWCAANASTTECDKQARKTFFKQVITNFAGFTPSDAGVEEFWMVYKGILVLPYSTYTATTTSVATNTAIFSRSSLPITLATTTFSFTSKTTIPGYWTSTSTPAPTGGVISTSTSYTIHTFATSTTFTSPTTFSLSDLIIIGGGGNGGTPQASRPGGGGGAAQYIATSTHPLTPQTYTITVGTAGNSTTAFGYTAIGGGHANGGIGASGAGVPYGTGGAGTAGYKGGNANSAYFNASGGGGAAGAGQDGVSGNAGVGGNGVTSSITGTAVEYACGGGGGNNYGAHASHPCGGTGGYYSNNGGNATTPGSGGGGSGGYGSIGGNAMPGIVVLRYLTSLFQGTSTIYVATTTIQVPIKYLNLVPPGLLSDLQYNATYSTSTFALATSTKIVSEATYNELLNTPIRINSDVDVLFDYALPYATSTCSGQSATSSCVIAARKTKVKDTVSVLSGFVMSDAALEELYKVKSNELTIVPMTTLNASTTQVTQNIILPMSTSEAFTTFSTTTVGTSTMVSANNGSCLLGTVGATTSVCYIDLPYINSAITGLTMSYDVSTSSIATSTVTSYLSYITQTNIASTTATSTPTFTTTVVASTTLGQKMTGVKFAFDLTTLFKSFLISSSSKLTLVPSVVGTTTLYAITNPSLAITRNVIVPKVSYALNSNQFISFDRSTISSFATSTATTTIDLTSAPQLDLSTVFFSPVDKILSNGTSYIANTVVATTSIIAYYKLDSSSSDSAGSNNGSDSNISYSSANGKINNGTGFNGSSSDISVSAFSSLSTNFTLNYWVKHSSGTGNQLHFMTGSSATGALYTWRNGTSGNLSFTEQGVADYNCGTVLSISVWHMITVVKNGDGSSNVKCYIDGIQTASTLNVGTIAAPSGTAHLGNWNNAGNWMNGALDEVSVWGRVLTTTEISSLYNSGAGLQYPFQTLTATSTGTSTPNYAGSIIDPTYPSSPVPPQTVLSPLPQYPYLSPASVSTSTLYTLTSLSIATTTDTIYTPFSNYVSASSTVTTYFTLNGTLVGAYTYQKGNEASTGKLTYAHTNYLGTPVLETDDKGDIVQMDITDVFGNYVQRDQRNDNAYHNKGYTGHEFDDVMGLTYSHARYLDTKMHSFNSVDPMLYKIPENYLTDPQQMNSYAYARNNPIVYTDPTGEFIQLPILFGLAALATFAIDTYNSYKTFSNPQSTPTQKNTSALIVASNLIPGGSQAKTGVSAAKQALKIVESQATKIELRNGAKILSGSEKPSSVYHYTNEAGLKGILESSNIRPSTQLAKPRDARLGDGQYFSDIAPGSKSNASLAQTFKRNRFLGSNFTHFIEISTEGLDVAASVDRKGVYLIPNDNVLDISSRIIRYGDN